MDIDVKRDFGPFALDVRIDCATEGVTAGGRLFQGRTQAQAPQVDGTTYVQSNHDLTPGEVVRCKIIAYDDYDLIAAPLRELNKTTSLNIIR